MHKINITIAGITINLKSPLSAAELGIQVRLEQFFKPVKAPLANLSLRWEESSSHPEPKGDIIYDPGSIWKMYKDGSDYYAVMIYDNDPAKPKGILRANPEWNDMTLIEHREGNEWQSLLNVGASATIVKTAIIFTGGLAFHASGLDDNGRGILFAGHSGAGKSTQAGLWKHETGVTAMNDDRMAVRIESGIPMCYGTPWGGTADIARNHCAPLSVIIVLEQSPVSEIELIKPYQAAPLLAARAFLPYWDSTLMIKAMENLNNILEHVPVYHFRFRPDKEVIALVRSVLC